MLRPHQILPANHLLEILGSQMSAVDFSDMGTGKTYVAAHVAAGLRLPTLVVCPDISQSAWHRAAAAFGDTLSVINYESLRTGKSPFGWWDKPQTARTYAHKCVNCQCKFKDGVLIPACYCRPDGIHCFDTQKVSSPRGKFNFHPNVKFIIFDEIHRCNGLHSLNADMLIAAKRDDRKILGLSATAAYSPLHMRALGYVLGLHGLANFYSWAMSKGCRKIPGGGFEWAVGKEKQAQVMRDINAQIFPGRGVRVRIEDIPDFPECDVASELYDLAAADRIDLLYKEMTTAIEQLKEHALTDKDSDHPLTKRIRAREEIELLKVPIAEQLTRDYTEKGFSVAIFLNFASSLKALSARLGTDCTLDGRTTGGERTRNIESFQRNEKKEILINTKVGGVALSLPDEDGNHPRVGLVMPTDSAVDMIQIFGRLPRHGGKSKSHYRVLLADKTCEIKIHKAFLRNAGNLAALNDADFRPELDI